MRWIMLLACSLAFLVAPLLAGPRSSWGTGGCTAQEAVASAQLAAPYAWHYKTSDGAYLYRGAQQIGGWDAIMQGYRPLLDYQRSIWGPLQPDAPFPPPPELVRSSPVMRAYQLDGVNRSKLSIQPQHSINGVIISHQDGLCPKAYQALADDSKKLYFGVWSRDPAKRAAIVADLKRVEGKWADERCHIWAEAGANPDLPINKDREDKSTHDFTVDPTVTLQSPDGVELWRDQGYTQGPSSLQSMRKRDPLYKPDDTPGPHRPGPKNEEDYTGLMVLVGAALLALLCMGLAKMPDA